MRIKIDLRKCQGFGMCQEAAPHVFKVNESDGYAVALAADVAGADAEAAADAAAACPMSAITLEPADGGR